LDPVLVGDGFLKRDWIRDIKSKQQVFFRGCFTCVIILKPRGRSRDPFGGNGGDNSGRSGFINGSDGHVGGR
jgi:hypothetical protein